MNDREHYIPTPVPEAEQSETAQVDPLTATSEEYDAALARVVEGVRSRAQREHPSRRPVLPREGATYDTRPLRDRLADDDE